MNYVKFTEYNDWEGETWHFFIPLDGNEGQIKKLKELIAEYQDECPVDFELNETPISGPEVDALIKHANGDTGYMNQFNKLEGTLNVDSVSSDREEKDRSFYKGGIQKYVETNISRNE